MDTEDLPVVLSHASDSTLSLSVHPLPILNISEHLTRRKLQTLQSSPFIFGALLGTQNGREVDIVNTFELALDETSVDAETATGSAQLKVDHGFLVSRRDQYKAVFPSLELIGWYTYAAEPTVAHIALNEQFTSYTSTPLLLTLTPSQTAANNASGTADSLPLKAYEPTVEIRERKSRTVFIEVGWKVQTGEAERIAVDWTARGGEGGGSLISHLQTQRSAIKMLHDRILVLVEYVASVLAGTAKSNHEVLRALSALVASLPASENIEFREEFDTEYADVQLTGFLSTLTKTATILNDLVDKHVIMTASHERENRGSGGGGGGRRRGPGFPMMVGGGGRDSGW